MKHPIIFTAELECTLSQFIDECKPDKVFILTDDVTIEACYPIVQHFYCLKNSVCITIPSSDNNKTLGSLTQVWNYLQKEKATRHSLLINLGGGMITDLGGFAAATFKRGMRFINLPTTVLAMVDASVGGKTGINFGGLKNEIGAFCDAEAVLIDTKWLKTLDKENILSGYAEMLKHGLLSERSHLTELLTFDIDDIDLKKLFALLEKSVEVKKKIVEKDPHEQNIRKALNYGHTFGHAFESWAMRRNQILHGYAVAYGIVCELYLSVVLQGFPTDVMRQVVNFIKAHYGVLPISCDDYLELISLMQHDKKNHGGTINFTLLQDVGKIAINQTASEEMIREALDFLREG